MEVEAVHLRAQQVIIDLLLDRPAPGVDCREAVLIPRVIVTDGWAGNLARFPDGRVFLVTNDGHRLPSRLRPSRGDHVFGPALVDPPEGLHGAGLSLNAAPLAKGARVQVAIAAGERVGLSSGVIPTGRPEDLQIQPIGVVADLVHVRCAVAPGSSGAPVVDDRMHVRGFVVAGSLDANRPDSFLLPAGRWARAVRTSNRPARPSRRRTRTRATKPAHPRVGPRGRPGRKGRLG
jgi:hypothetical protein